MRIALISFFLLLTSCVMDAYINTSFQSAAQNADNKKAVKVSVSGCLIGDEVTGYSLFASCNEENAHIDLVWEDGTPSNVRNSTVCAIEGYLNYYNSELIGMGWLTSEIGFIEVHRMYNCA